MPYLFKETFESGSYSTNFVDDTSGANPWVIENTDVASGTYAVKSGTAASGSGLRHDFTTTTTVDYPLRFTYKAAGTAGDFTIITLSGGSPTVFYYPPLAASWAPYVVDVPAGTDSIVFAVNNGSTDTMKIDNVWVGNMMVQWNGTAWVGLKLRTAAATPGVISYSDTFTTYDTTYWTGGTNTAGHVAASGGNLVITDSTGVSPTIGNASYPYNMSTAEGAVIFDIAATTGITSSSSGYAKVGWSFNDGGSLNLYFYIAIQYLVTTGFPAVPSNGVYLTTPNGAFVAYNSLSQRYLRVRVDGLKGLVYFEYSANKTTWTILSTGYLSSSDITNAAAMSPSAGAFSISSPTSLSLNQMDIAVTDSGFRAKHMNVWNGSIWVRALN